MNGFIVIDKPKGITSFKAIARLRRVCAEKKAGHSGTLDPMATGVLVCALGRATPFLDLLESHDKSYDATFRLGVKSDTLDVTGTLEKVTDDLPGFDEVLTAAKRFEGEIEQTPPMYSAVKIDGKRLYDLARQGVTVERKTRKATIYSLNLSRLGDEYALSVVCSRGTYVRTLVDDIGAALGCGAVLTSLRRTSANGFTLERAVTLDELEEGGAELARQRLITVENAFSALPGLTVSQKQSVRFSNGGELDRQRLHTNLSGSVRVYSPEGKFLGLGALDDESLEIKKLYIDDEK